LYDRILILQHGICFYAEQKNTNMHRDPVSSASLKSIGYNEDQEILEVEFVDGGVYQYLEVPREEYVALMGAESHGSYFSHNIRGTYEYRVVEEENMVHKNQTQ
jgi:hypothetical protein